VAAEVVSDDDLARREGRGEDLLEAEAEEVPLIGPSFTQGASIRSRRPWGAWAFSRRPLALSREDSQAVFANPLCKRKTLVD
jgi:hypothetical protein